jgi:hypothetical protein
MIKMSLVIRPRHDDDEVEGGKGPKALWDGPPGMKTATTFKAYYTQLCEGNAQKLQVVSRFVRETLGVPNASLEHIMTELEDLRENRCNDLDRISGLYSYLAPQSTAVGEADENIR